MGADHQKEEEFNLKEGENKKWQDIKMNNAVFAVEKVKNCS